MVPLVELPIWLQAAGWGLLSASGLLVGAFGGYYTRLQHTAIARVMTFGAGVLLAVVAVDLVIGARGAASLTWTVTGLLSGAAVFSSLNWVVARRGGKHRKRCGECVEQPEERREPGSGLAIAAGTFLDGVPEGVVLGVSVLHQGAPGLGTVAAFFLANIPEALSSSAGMRRAGRSARYVFGLWLGIALTISLAAALAGLVLGRTEPVVRGTVEAFAAGAILAMVSETMIPEAFHGSPEFNGLLLVIGFVALLILLILTE
ncbi:MAG TPA: ZIP family metal transporter [Pyrinomonadaceae bacterium]|nr:ZIP family metal transporter [Pyrinomonadaceae bacterium]